jgi:transposase
MNTTEEKHFAALVAIDWADAKHEVALYAVGAKKIEHGTLQHRPEALRQWVGELRTRFGGAPVAVIVEQTRGALIHALIDEEFLCLFPANPAMVAHLRKAFHNSGAKSDLADCDLLLEILLKHRDRLRPLPKDDVQTRTLRLLVEDRRRAVEERGALAKQLLATLKGYCPALIELAGPELSTKLACELIIKWPTLEKLQGAKVHTLRKFFYAHNSRSSAKLEDKLAALGQAQPLCTDAAIIEAGQLKAIRLAKQILAILPAIKVYEERIGELFESHPDAAIFKSFPGAGDALGPRLLTALGSQRPRWSSSQEIATANGIAPVIEASGNKKVVHWRWACPKFMRQTFQEFAGVSTLFCPWAKTYYQRQIGRGTSHHAALRALAFKWIRILFRCWKDRCPYDPAKYAPASM